MEHHTSNSPCMGQMALNWDYQNICVIFSNWQIRTLTGLLAVCIGTFCLSLTYELARLVSRILDHQIVLRRGINTRVKKDAHLFVDIQKVNTNLKLSYSEQVIRSSMYTIQVSISFCLMLVFMSFNGFLMLSVILGAFVGFLLFSQDTLVIGKDSSHH